MRRNSLTFKQLLWIRSRGGRTFEDVLVHDNKYVIYMDNTAIEVPPDSNIKFILKQNKYIKML